MSDRTFRCSHASESAREPLLGTASTVRNWLLIEHAGSWGENALRDARMPDGLGDELRRRERALGVRVLLIRRVDRRSGDRAACFVIHTGPDRPWIEHTELEDVRDTLALDLQRLARGEPIGLTPVEGPLFCVCTHGKRDPCCAERGRPLALAVSKAFPEETWESAHVGGDRFAGNLVAFPHGLYLGRVGPDRGPDVAAMYAEGRIDLEHLRGRSCHPMDVQAAEHFVRAEHGLDLVDDVIVDHVTRRGDVTLATFRTSLGALRVRVRRGFGPPAPLTCHSHVDEHPLRFELLAIEEA